MSPSVTLHKLRPEQETAVAWAAALTPGQRLLCRAPTGSGKSTVEAALLLAGWTVAAPSMDICDGIARAARIEAKGTEAARRKRYEAAGLWTYKRLHSHLAGTGAPPTKLCLDEAHHTGSDTTAQLIALARDPTLVGLTATTWRGTPDETDRLHALYHGNVRTVLTLADSLRQGYTVLPTFDVWPLIDDELIDVTGGEFSVRGCERAAVEQAPTLCRMIVDARNGRPGTLVLPSIDACEEYARTFDTMGAETVTVVAGTRDRQALFARVLAGDALLLQVRAVGEGTDLALRFMVDAAPTMSPVLWYQRVGRLTRPGGTSTYVTTCHNLMRHAYLFEGLVPAGALKKAVSCWPDGFQPSRRTMCRALGLTGFGRFEPCTVPLADGSDAFMYALRDKTGENELAAVLIPGAPNPLYFHRASRIVGTEAREVAPGIVRDCRVMDRGKWAPVAKLPTLADCASLPASPLTPKQKQWWESAAEKRGLNPDTERVTARSFAILPILTDARVRIVT